ncbi:hypothetical protein R0C40_01340, partial [Escherichia coli]|uniref:hypothetical protein n=1 Tax=Escherichia coli TaxID=562 RepID=UPI00396C66C9
LRFSGPKTSIICSPMTSLKTSIKTITYLSDIGCLEIQGASLDTRISVIASDADHTVFLKKGSFASRKTDDMLLLQETERALAD